jgi:hypothetical protein
MSEQKTLQELESYQARLEADVRRSRMQDNFGLSKTDPLLRNLSNVKEEIKKLKESTGS